MIDHSDEHRVMELEAWPTIRLLEDLSTSMRGTGFLTDCSHLVKLVYVGVMDPLVEALVYCQEAVSLFRSRLREDYRRDLAPHLDTLGMALFAVGRVLDALDEALKLISTGHLCSPSAATHSEVVDSIYDLGCCSSKHQASLDAYSTVSNPLSSSFRFLFMSMLIYILTFVWSRKDTEREFIFSSRLMSERCGSFVPTTWLRARGAEGLSKRLYVSLTFE
jgi:hypothetical protein